MKNILVAVDGSDCSKKAVKLAIEIASKMGARITAVNVVVPPYIPPEPYATGSAGLELAIRQYGEDVAKEAAKEALQAGLEATWRIETGAPADVLNQTASATKADMIVVGSRGHGALRRALLGSVSSRLAHLSEVPLLIVH